MCDIEELLFTLRDLERQILEIGLSAMRDAGIAVPDIEATAAARWASDEDDEEEVPRQVRVTMRFAEEDGRTIDTEDVVTKVRAALLAARFAMLDPSVERD